MITPRDYLIGALAGFLTGIFAIPVFYDGLKIQSVAILAPLPFAVALIWAFGVWLGGFLGRWFAVMSQFGKFVAVGFLNTAVDFGILNLFSLATDVTAGIVIGIMKIIAFLIAAFNSYFWNRLWVFPQESNEKLFEDFKKFLVITILGAIFGGVIVYALTTFVAPPFGLNPKVWLNLANVAAAAFSLLWNFLGYKFLVFKA